MKLIGLTGGIGSGKSMIAGIFGTLGIPVYESDSRAKALMNKDEQLRQEVLALFGPKAYPDGQNLHRKWLADQVFSNPNLLKHLNSIVHPAVYRDLLKWTKDPMQQQAPYLLQESAILFEENLNPRMSAMILVVAKEEIRIARVTSRDGISIEEVQARIKNQWPDVEKIPLADYVIYNDGEHSLIDQVMDIDRMIRATAHASAR